MSVFLHYNTFGLNTFTAFTSNLPPHVALARLPDRDTPLHVPTWRDAAMGDVIRAHALGVSLNLPLALPPARKD